MEKTILDLIKKTKADIIENLNPISQDFVNDNALDQIDYLGDAFTECADNDTSVYYADQRDYFNNHTEECENALPELYGNDSLIDLIKSEGLDGLICKAGACGEYQANLNELYEDEDKIKEVLTLEYLEEHADEFPTLTESQLADLLNECHGLEPSEIVEALDELKEETEQWRKQSK